MQDTFAKQSGRRAAKRDRIERIGRVEQAILTPLRIALGWAKQLFTDKETRNRVLETPEGQIILIVALVGLLIGAGFVDHLVDGLLGQ